MAGVSQADVARVAGLSQSHVSRAELDQGGALTIEALAVHFAVLGLRLSIKAYPAGSPVRDAAHLELLAKLRSNIHPEFTWRAEAPIGTTGDLRAWDALLTGPIRIGVDAETRLHDIQALQRRTEVKARDSAVQRVVLLVSNSAHNRQVLREHAASLLSTFPLGHDHTLEALRRGRDPGANGLIKL